MISRRSTTALALLVTGLFYLTGCQMPTDTVNEDPITTSEPSASTVSHGYVAGITPSNIDPDSAERSYTVIEADWNGPGGDKRWIGANLGAEEEATSVADSSRMSAGWYFQFNHKQGLSPTQGNDQKVSDHKAGPTGARQDPDLDSDWIHNDPCELLLGGEWRIPTFEEWEAVAAAGAEDELNLHFSGYISGNLSFLSERGTSGLFWSSTQGFGANTGLFANYNSSTDLTTNTDGKLMWSGMPLRCIED